MVALSIIVVLASCQSSPAPTSQPQVPDIVSLSLEQALSSGRPTLAEFGSTTCIPRKEIQPILQRLAVTYKDRLNVITVEVYEQKALTQMNGIMAIPTQVVFDASGKELTRHVGLWHIKDIIVQLKKMGIE